VGHLFKVLGLVVLGQLLKLFDTAKEKSPLPMEVATKKQINCAHAFCEFSLHDVATSEMLVRMDLTDLEMDHDVCIHLL